MKTLIHLLLTLITLSVTAAQAAVPANDNLIKAIVLAGNCSASPTVHDLSTATASSTDPMTFSASSGKTLWFRFPQPAASGTLNVTVNGLTASGFATAYQILDIDNPVGSLFYQNAAVVSVNQTTTLKVTNVTRPVAIMLSGTGTFTIGHRFSDAQSSNDFRADATLLPGNKGTMYGNNRAATASADEVLPSPGTNTVWYSWTPTFSGKACVDTRFSYIAGEAQFDPDNSGPSHQVVLAVYSSAGTVLDWDTGGAAAVSFTASSGKNYVISVSTVAGYFPGEFDLHYYPGNGAGEIYLAANANDLGASSGDAGQHTIVVRRRYDDGVAASCTFSTVAGGSAIANKDYTPVNKTLSFAANESEQTVDVPLLADPTNTSFRDLNVALSNPVNATLAAGDSSGHINIVSVIPFNNKFTVFPEVLRVSESRGTVAVLVQRRFAGDYEDLTQAPINGPAVEGTDFTVQQGSMFTHELSKAVYFSPIDNDVFDGDREVTISVAGEAQYTVVIEDDDPYIPVAGKLTALLQFGGLVRPALLTLTTAGNGSVTGRIALLGRVLPVVGKLDEHGKLTLPLAIPGRASLMLRLAARNQKGTFKLDLYDNAAASAALSTATATLQNFAPVVSPCPWAARYTITGPANSVNAVEVTLVATVSTSTTGTTAVTGRTVDGVAFTAAGYVDGLGTLAAMMPLYAGQGGVAFGGTLPLTDNSTASHYVTFIRPARESDPTHLGPVAISQLLCSICRYSPPPVGTVALDCWSGGTGKAVLSKGPLMNNITKVFNINAANAITPPVDAEKLKLSLVPGTGFFTGSFIVPGTIKPIAIYGVLTDLPASNGIGTGLFFDGVKGGRIDIGKP